MLAGQDVAITSAAGTRARGNVTLAWRPSTHPRRRLFVEIGEKSLRATREAIRPSLADSAGLASLRHVASRRVALVRGGKASCGLLGLGSLVVDFAVPHDGFRRSLTPSLLAVIEPCVLRFDQHAEDEGYERNRKKRPITDGKPSGDSSGLTASVNGSALGQLTHDHDEARRKRRLAPVRSCA